MPNVYADTILRARRDALPTLSAGLRYRMARLLAEALDRVFARYLGTAGGPPEITEDVARQMVADVERALTRYGLRARDEVLDAMGRAAGMGAGAHTNALARLLDATGGEGPSAAASFSGVPAEALERLAAGREAGLTYRSLSRWNAQRNARAVNEALDRMVADGESWQTAARRIMHAVATGDSYLEAVARDYGPRGGLTRAARLRGVTADPEAAQVARRLGYDARRIAVTETNAAYREADNLAAARSPVLAGLRWTLSPRHPAWDVCDVYAGLDLYGLGPGVFPGGKMPVTPHPFCACVPVPVLRPEGEWRKPKPGAGRPALRPILAVPSPASVTGRARQRAIHQALRDVAAAYAEHERPALRRAA